MLLDSYFCFGVGAVWISGAPSGQGVPLSANSRPLPFFARTHYIPVTAEIRSHLGGGHESVSFFADLPSVLASPIELEQPRTAMREGSHGADGDGGMPGACIDEKVALGISSDASDFAEMFRISGLRLLCAAKCRRRVRSTGPDCCPALPISIASRQNATTPGAALIPIRWRNDRPEASPGLKLSRSLQLSSESGK